MYTTDVKVADGASAAVRTVKLARTLMRCTAFSKRPGSAAVDRRAEGAAGSAALEAAERIFPPFSVMVQVARFVRRVRTFHGEANVPRELLSAAGWTKCAPTSKRA